MNKVIDVIIPAYNAHKTIDRTLYSIGYQTIKDKINVYICNDKSDKDYKDVVNFFKNYIDIEEIDLEVNSGPGIARETGIQHSNSEYIVFIDSDDCFCSPRSLEILYDAIDKEQLDFVNSIFFEDTLNSGAYEHKYDEIYLHGKIYRRSFLEDHNIHFNSEIKTNEDNYFNSSLLLFNPRRKYLNVPTYIWKYNDQSITRKNNNEFRFSGIYSYVGNMREALKFGIANNANKSIIAERAFGTLNAMYYYYLEYEEDDFLKLSKDVYDIYKEYKDYFDKYGSMYYDIMGYQDRNNFENVLTAKISFYQFLEKVGEVK